MSDKRIYHEFNTDNEAKQWADVNFKQWLHALNEKKSESTNLLYYYSGNLSILYNRYLKGLFSFSPNEIEEYLKGIDTLVDEIHKNELPENIIVYRYTRKKWMEEIMTSANFKSEKTFIDKGFLSTTLVPDLLRKFAKKHRYDCVLKIFLPKGTKAVYINYDNSVLNEHEILLPPNSSLRLIKKHISMRYSYVYECELIDQ